MVPPISSRSDTWPTGYAAAMGRVTPRDIERPVEEIYDPVELSVRQRARRYMEVLETQNWSEPYITRSSSVPNMVEEANRYLYVSERANDPRMYGEVVNLNSLWNRFDMSLTWLPAIIGDKKTRKTSKIFSCLSSYYSKCFRQRGWILTTTAHSVQILPRIRATKSFFNATTL